MNTMFVFIESMDILSTIPQNQKLLGILLLFWIVWYVSKRRNNRRNDEHRNEPMDEEVLKKISEWQPESLVPKVPADHPLLSPSCIESKIGKRTLVNGIDCLNLATHSYLGLHENKEIEKKALAAVQKYGVGSCGPRGFYGTIDIHLDLEERLAKFMGSEEAIVYSYGFSTISSAISAYCKRNDLVFADEKVHFAIQKGLDASRSNVKYFKHNDVNDFHRLLKEQDEIDKKNSKKATKIRRFLIIEGIYRKTGEICPLPELVALCRQYKLRLFVDESISLGTLGAKGKGVTEYFNVPLHEVDMIIGCLEHAIGSVGGFCIGTSFIIDHQRLSGLGYCFSASTPPLLTAAAIGSLDIIENDAGILNILRENCKLMNQAIKKMKFFQTTSFPESPVKHLHLKAELDHKKKQEYLTLIVKKCLDKKLAVVTPPYLEAERELPTPSIQLCVSTLLDKSDIEFAISTLEECAQEVLADHYN